MFEEEFQYQENSLDLIIKFPSETEQSLNREDDYIHLSVKDNHPTSLVFPAQCPEPEIQLSKGEVSEGEELERMR